MPSCNTYHLTWVFLTLGVGYLFMAAPAKHSRCSLPWRRGISLLLLSWHSMWDSFSRPSCACAATAPAPRLLLPAAGPGLGRGWLLPVQPLALAQGGSSGSPPLASGVRWLLLAASNLGRGVFPPSCHWPPSCGSSSRPPPGHRTCGVPSLPPSLTSDTGCLLPTSAPDLRRGVAPPSGRP